MFEDYPTASEAERRAEEYATPLDALIRPDDVDPGAETWGEIDRDLLHEEVWEAVSVTRSEHGEMRHLIRDHAFRLWTDDLVRQPRGVLDDSVSDEDLIHEFGIWPFDMNKWDCYEIAHQVYETPDREIHPSYIEEAEEPVIAGLRAGMMPESVEEDR